MIEEAIKHVEAQAQKNVKPEVFHLDGDPPYVHRVKTKDGDISQIVVEPTPKGNVAGSIEDLVALAREYGEGRNEKNPSAFFITPGSVELIYNTENGREKAVYSLQASVEQRFIKKLVDSQGRVQVADLSDALRYQLYRANPSPELIEGVARLRVTSHSDTNQSTGRSQESLGSSVTTEASGGPERDLPQREQSLNLRMFSNTDLDVRFYVEFLLDPDMGHKGWIFWPIPDSYDDWLANTLAVIKARITELSEDLNVPCFIAKW